MSSANPRRRMVTRSSGEAEKELALKTNMALRKGATFHSPNSSAPATDEEIFLPPRLPRAHSQLDDASGARGRRIALTLNDIDEALAKTESLSLLDKKPTDKIDLKEPSTPLPQGLLQPPVVDPDMAKQNERRVLRPRSVRRTRQHTSDSGLGSSLASSNDKLAEAEITTKKNTAKTQPMLTSQARNAASGTTLPGLSRRAVGRIHEHTLQPLLEVDELKEFRPIVLDIPRRIRSKEIICLRDVEKTLIFMAPVSQLLTDKGVWGNAYRNLRLKEKAKSATIYLDFCLMSIRCVQATVEYLTDREQTRPGDRPYTNGYFIDLKEQLLDYGRQLAAKELSDKMDIDQYVPTFVPLTHSTNKRSRNDEIRLHGGIAETGRPAELIRVKQDGTAISMATGEVVDLKAPITFKRSLSEQLDDDEDIMRSMARRKKNATPEELAPKKCREPGCDKEFKRPCDLTKHEKTHSRPFKCPFPTCKYHNYGWPTAKEMDRHVNDKHSDKPSMYECQFKPCPYKSKRESNCKQHMEKAHGWTYVRTKTNGKKLPGKPDATAQQTPPSTVSPPGSTPGWSVPTPPQDAQAQMPDFPAYTGAEEWNALIGPVPASLDSLDVLMENPSPQSSSSYEQYPPYQNGSAFIINNEDIYAARAQITHQLHPEQIYQKMMQQQPQLPPNFQLPQPQQHQHMELPAHFSPVGQENAMLYTPSSLRDVDEAFDDSNVEGMDFQLFPANAGKANEVQPLFGEMPSANLGFSQTTQPDIFQQLDWSNVDYTTSL